VTSVRVQDVPELRKILKSRIRYLTDGDGGSYENFWARTLVGILRKIARGSADFTERERDAAEFVLISVYGGSFDPVGDKTEEIHRMAIVQAELIGLL
jgi:hypothetical protein